HPDLHSFPTRRSSDLLPSQIRFQFPFQPRAEISRLNRAPPLVRELNGNLKLRSLPTRPPSHCQSPPARAFIARGSRPDSPSSLRSEEHTSELQSLRHL